MRVYTKYKRTRSIEPHLLLFLLQRPFDNVRSTRTNGLCVLTFMSTWMSSRKSVPMLPARSQGPKQKWCWRKVNCPQRCYMLYGTSRMSTRMEL